MKAVTLIAMGDFDHLGNLCHLILVGISILRTVTPVSRCARFETPPLLYYSSVYAPLASSASPLREHSNCGPTDERGNDMFALTRKTD